MTLTRKSHRISPGVLLIVLLSAIFVIPPGVHVALCFGGDGHFDMAMDACSDTARQQPQHDKAEWDHHHRSNCLDIVIGCGPSAAQLLRPLDDDDILQAKTRKNNLQPTPYVTNPVFTFSIGAAIQFRGCTQKWAPATQLASIRSVILLI